MLQVHDDGEYWCTKHVPKKVTARLKKEATAAAKALAASNKSAGKTTVASKAQAAKKA
jgi:hypothetical protein